MVSLSNHLLWWDKLRWREPWLMRILRQTQDERICRCPFILHPLTPLLQLRDSNAVTARPFAVLG